MRHRFALPLSLGSVLLLGLSRRFPFGTGRNLFLLGKIQSAIATEPLISSRITTARTYLVVLISHDACLFLLVKLNLLQQVA
jgi:hypothetical protein